MKILGILMGLVLAGDAFAIDFAITMDDPNGYQKPLMTSTERDRSILAQLKPFGVKAVLFACGKRVDSEEGKKLLNRWNKEGHLIGNHTSNHTYYHDSTFEVFSSDVLKVESQINYLDNFEKIFRFPMLKSGDTVLKRDSIRNFLKSHNYSHGYVTVDVSDWYISDRLEKRLKDNPNANLKGYKDFYLQHMWERAQYYDSLARKVLGRSPKHTLLIHHNLLNALFLGDLIKLFISQGWRYIDADEAFDDFIFTAEPDTLPSGEGIIWALAKEAGFEGLRYPAEDGVYEKDEMDRLGL